MEEASGKAVFFWLKAVRERRMSKLK